MNHFLPGMGATSAMYGEVWRQAFEGCYHDWPRWRGEEAIKAMARRMISEGGIVEGDTVIGTSLGGIVACEIANLVELDQVVLIGSARRKGEVSQVLAALHPLIDVTPVSWAQFSSGKVPGALAEMFAESDPDFIREMSKAIFRWDGLVNEVPVFRIHGARDLVIPKPEDANCILDGGHLIAMTHAAECVEALKEALII